jgi:formylglycine-generating enzyme required for sulfatase activity
VRGASTLLVLVTAIVVLLEAAGPAGASDRVALVIGNDRYEDAPLRNARNDAEDLAKALRELGFSVRTVVDADLKTMEKAMAEFVRRIPREGVALFHFSGHGIQVEGENYLVPVGFEAENPVDAKYAAYSAERVLAHMEASPSRLNIVILDACRNNPFRTVRSGTRGLAIMNAGDGSLISYATAPGKTASDNPGQRNGLFTHHLLEALEVPGLGIEQVFKRARQGVYADSGEKQIPWTASSVIGDFVFREERSFLYHPEDVRRLERAVAAEGWSKPRRNTRGMLEVVHERTGLAFVLVPRTEFPMGSREGGEEEGPVRAVRVGAFLLCRTECTQAAWDRVGGADERSFRGVDLPVEGVSWEAARAWCDRAGLRLPSEAEWEAACRAGSEGRWSFGDEAERLPDHAWIDVNSDGRTHPVGEKAPNAWGLHDMHGNLWEFCEDDYVPTYEGAPADGTPRRSEEATHRVLRGGSWANHAELSRCSSRGYASPNLGGPKAGFRPAFSLPVGPDPQDDLAVVVLVRESPLDATGEPGELALCFFKVADPERLRKVPVEELRRAGPQLRAVPGGTALGRWRIRSTGEETIRLGPTGQARFTHLAVLADFPSPQVFLVRIPAHARLRIELGANAVLWFGAAGE